MSTLIVHLPTTAAAPAGEYAYALSGDGAQVQRHGCCAAALLPAAGRTGQVVAVVPHQALSWHLVHLPQGIHTVAARSQARLRAVLDGLLEERLLDDSSQLHLALEPGARAGSACWVAACDKHWLGGHVRALQACGRAADRIVPLCPPQSAPGLWLVGTEHSPWLLATGWQPPGQAQADKSATFACLPWGKGGGAQADAALLASLLQSLPPDTPVQAYPALARHAQALQRPLVLLTEAAHGLAASALDWDLAQFDFDMGRRSRARQSVLAVWHHFWRMPHYRPARWAAAFAVLAQILGLNAWAWQENRAIAAKRQQVRAVLLESFPQTPLVIDAPLQMQREVAALRQRAASLAPGDLEPLLAAAALALPASMPPQALQYQPGQLRMEGVSVPHEALEQARQRLSGSGLHLRQEENSLLVTTEAHQP